MDTMHPAIVDALSNEERAAHEGDSALYVRLAMSAMDINEVCRSTRHDLDRIGLMVSTAMLDIAMHAEAHRITEEQRDRLLALLKDGIDDEEPTVDNNVPVFRLRFPSPDYDPPPRAA